MLLFFENSVNAVRDYHIFIKLAIIIFYTYMIIPEINCNEFVINTGTHYFFFYSIGTATLHRVGLDSDHD